MWFLFLLPFWTDTWQRMNGGMSGEDIRALRMLVKTLAFDDCLLVAAGKVSNIAFFNRFVLEELLSLFRDWRRRRATRKSKCMYRLCGWWGRDYPCETESMYILHVCLYAMQKCTILLNVNNYKSVESYLEKVIEVVVIVLVTWSLIY